MPVYNVSDLFKVSMDSLLTWFDQGFEALFGVGFTDGVLPHFKAQKLKANATIEIVQGMTDARFAWL